MIKPAVVLLAVLLACVAAEITDEHLKRMSVAIDDLGSLFDETYTLERFEHGVRALREGHGEATLKVAAVREESLRAMFELMGITTKVLDTSTTGTSELQLSYMAKCVTSSDE